MFALPVDVHLQKHQISSPTGKPGSHAPHLPVKNHTHPRKPLLDLWLSAPIWRQQQQQQQRLGSPATPPRAPESSRAGHP